MSKAFGRPSGGAIFFLLFGLLAVLAWRAIPTPTATAEPPRAARDYARAWEAGDLANLDYDPASAPEVGGGDPDRIAANVRWIVRDLSGQDQDHPVSVRTVGEPRTQAGDRGELRDGDQIQPLEVVWDLGHRHRWTHLTEVVVRRTDGQERIVWRPNAVHPAITHGLVLRSTRLRPARAPILDGAQREMAAGSAAVLSGAAQPATNELAATYPDRVAPGDVIGISGLQHVYDVQLAGTTGVQVDVVRVEGYRPLEPPVRQLHVIPPVPGKPLQLSLDPTWQARANRAVAGATTPTAVVVLDALTGAVLADANGGPIGGRDIGLQAKYPPGAAFRVATLLALARHRGVTGATTTTCAPLTYDGQRFVDPATAPSGEGVDLRTAFAGNCLTGLARGATSLPAGQLRRAALDLGLGVPSATGANAFDGSPPAGSDGLGVVQDAVGEGSVLASPLAMARLSATVASGTQRAPTLITPVARTIVPAPSRPLSASEQGLLADMMAASVLGDPQLAPLRTDGIGRVFAVGGTAGYGPAAAAPVHAWCTGYQGNLAFAVFVQGDPATAAADPYRARQAAEVAARLLKG